MSGGDSWRFRAVIFFSLLLVWAAAALLRAVWLAGPRSAEYIAQGEKMARFHGTLPAMRGRILDRAGRTLVWSERYFDLYLTLPDGMKPEDETFDAVRETVKDLKIPEAGTGTPVLLKRDLAPAELLALEPVVKNNRAFRIESRVERIAVSNPAARSRLGTVKREDGELVGASGLEAEFDARLRGRPGRFEVMLDRRRNWIAGSWKLLEEPAPGEDIRLDVTLETLMRRPAGEEAEQ